MSTLRAARSRLLPLLLVAAAALFPGCSTVCQWAKGPDGPAAFGGVRSIAGALVDLGHGSDGGIAPTIALCFDVWISFVADVVILPYSAINELLLVDGFIDPPTFYELWRWLWGT